MTPGGAARVRSSCSRPPGSLRRTGREENQGGVPFKLATEVPFLLAITTPESLVGRQGIEPWTLGSKVPSRQLSTHVHGRPPTSTGDPPIAVPRFHGRPPMSTDVHRLGCHLAVIKTASAGDRPRRRPQLAGGVRIWEGASGRGAPAEVCAGRPRARSMASTDCWMSLRTDRPFRGPFHGIQLSASGAPTGMTSMSTPPPVARPTRMAWWDCSGSCPGL